MPWAKVASGTFLQGDRPTGDRRHDGGGRRCAHRGCRGTRRRRYLVDRRRSSRADLSGLAGQGVVDVGLQGVGLGAEDRLDVVADLDHAGGTERLQPGLVDLALVGDLHAQPGDAGVDVDQVLPATEGGDQLLGLARHGARAASALAGGAADHR